MASGAVCHVCAAQHLCPTKMGYAIWHPRSRDVCTNEIDSVRMNVGHLHVFLLESSAYPCVLEYELCWGFCLCRGRLALFGGCQDWRDKRTCTRQTLPVFTARPPRHTSRVPASSRRANRIAPQTPAQVWRAGSYSCKQRRSLANHRRRGRH